MNGEMSLKSERKEGNGPKMIGNPKLSIVVVAPIQNKLELTNKKSGCWNIIFQAIVRGDGIILHPSLELLKIRP